MGFPFPDNDDHLGQYDDAEPVECCRHDVPVSEPCDDCAEADDQHWQERYHGSDQPVTLQEQYDAAAEQKRRLG